MPLVPPCFCHLCVVEVHQPYLTPPDPEELADTQHIPDTVRAVQANMDEAVNQL